MEHRQGSALGWRIYAGLFLVALATMMYEILLTRIFSVTMWYHFAFMAISLAMFGMTLGTIIVYLRPATFTPERAQHYLALNALLFSVSIVFTFLTHLCIPFKQSVSILGVYSIGLNYVVISVPFIFSGICISLALTKFPRREPALRRRPRGGGDWLPAVDSAPGRHGWPDGRHRRGITCVLGAQSSSVQTRASSHAGPCR